MIQNESVLLQSTLNLYTWRSQDLIAFNMSLGRRLLHCVLSWRQIALIKQTLNFEIWTQSDQQQLTMSQLLLSSASIKSSVSSDDAWNATDKKMFSSAS